MGLRLVEVHFAGNQQVLEDSGSHRAYTAPHWKDNSGDGTASHLGDRSFPVAYRRGERPRVKAIFDLGTSATPAAFLVRGTNLPAQALVTKGARATYTECEATVELTDKVTLLDFAIKWEASADGGATWSPVITSHHRVYVTLGPSARSWSLGGTSRDNPRATRLYETALDIGCRYATGHDGESAVVAAIWAQFCDLDVRRKPIDGYNVPDGVQMGYWMNDAKKVPQSCEAMLNDPSGDGSCRAWAQLFQHILFAQGISTPQICVINSPHAFLVRHWKFVESLPPIDPNHLYSVDGTVTNGNRLPAQNNADSSRSFVNHFIVFYNGEYYDPSYGAGPFANPLLHENAASAGACPGKRTANEKDRRLHIQDLTYTNQGLGNAGRNLPHHVRAFVGK